MKSTVPVIVPIFDGFKNLSPSMKGFLEKNFPGLLMSDNSKRESIQVVGQGVGGEDAEVNIGCSKWWWHCNPDITKASATEPDHPSYTYSTLHQQGGTDISISSDNAAMNADSEVIDFYFVPIVKRNNHKKHNSHQWFFDSICMGLGKHVEYIYLTGISYFPLIYIIV